MYDSAPDGDDQREARGDLSDNFAESIPRQVIVRNNKFSVVTTEPAFPDHLPDRHDDFARTRQSTAKERNQPVARLIANYRLKNLGSLEETVLELYHANLSMQQLVHLIRQLWGKRGRLSTIVKLHGEAIAQIEAWRERPISKIQPYVYLAGVELKCRVGYETKQASILTAVGVDEAGVRQVLGVTEGERDSHAAWYAFLQRLKNQGLRGVRMFIGDRSDGLAGKLELIYPGMHFQNRVVQFHHDVLSRVPICHLLEMGKRLQCIDNCTDWSSASKLVGQMVAEMKRLNLSHVAEFYETHVWATLNYLAFPSEYRRGLRSNSVQIKLLRSIRERTRMVGAFSDGTSAVHLVSARLRHIESTIWSEKRYVWGHL
jgi:transposase-like protein